MYIDPTGKRWAMQYNEDDKKWYYAWFKTDKEYDAALASGHYQAVDFDESKPYEFIYQEQSEIDLGVRLNPDGTHPTFDRPHPGGAPGIDMMQNQAFEIGISNATGGLISRAIRAVLAKVFATTATDLVTDVAGQAVKDTATETLPDVIYRAGKTNPGNLTPRAVDDGVLSFRDSLSNPYPLEPGQQPVFRFGDNYFGVETSKLPAGSVMRTGPP